MGNVRSARAAAVAVVLAGGLAGCVGLFADGEKSEQKAVTKREAAVAVATADPGKVIARATFDSPQAKGAKVEIGLVSLKATGTPL